MNRIFVYEYVSAGGPGGRTTKPLPPSFYQEGSAMLTALVSDFARLPDVEVVAMLDSRRPPPAVAGPRFLTVQSAQQARDCFDTLAAAADWTVVIAPESSGHLLRLCRRAEAVGGRLLGPGPEVVRIASHKQWTATCLQVTGVPVPEGIVVGRRDPLPEEFPYPAVLKPLWGAGSSHVRLVSPGGIATCPPVQEDFAASPPSEPVFFGEADRQTEPREGACRLERYCPGVAASVAVLCGPGLRCPLPPCRQNLSADGRFRYLGGSTPLPPSLARRATRLAEAAIASLPEPLGYLGVDLALGDAPDGGDDFVIEINPRPTTSYVGLRAAAADGCNLAAGMLAIAEGRACRLSFRQIEVQYDPDGTVRLHAP